MTSMPIPSQMEPSSNPVSSVQRGSSLCPKLNSSLIPLQAMKGSDYGNIISTIAFFTLFAGAGAAAIYFGIHPSTDIVQITPNFSMSMPLMVTTGTGGLAAIFFVVQAKRKSVTDSFVKGFAKIAGSSSLLRKLSRFAVHPGGRLSAKGDEGLKFMQTDECHKQFLQLGAEVITFLAPDKTTLRGYWWGSQIPHAQTVVLFHGNCMTAAEMWQYASLYHDEWGFNVFIPEYRGYGMSEGTSAGVYQEWQAYCDLSAVKEVLVEKGIDIATVTAHGYSLGGAYATALAYYYGIPNIVLDHAFTTPAATERNVAQKYITKLKMPASSQASAMQGINALNLPYPSKKPKVEFKEMPDKEIDENGDGWDNVRKLREMQGQKKVFVIHSKSDELMAPDFGEKLVDAAYGYDDDDSFRSTRLLVVPGGHTEVEKFVYDPSNHLRLFDFLSRNVF